MVVFVMERDGDVKTAVYEIRLKGHIGQRYANWFDGMALTLAENGETVICGELVDQAALYGLLRKVRDLGLPLLSVKRIGD